MCINLWDVGTYEWECRKHPESSASIKHTIHNARLCPPPARRYAVVSPLILPLGLLYFITLWPVWRYQMLCVAVLGEREDYVMIQG